MTEVMARHYYEGEAGGWFDGRLGQAYDTIWPMIADHPDWEPDLRKLLVSIEGLADAMKKEAANAA